MKRLLFLALLSVWMAIPVLAADEWGFTGCSSGSVATSGSVICYSVDENSSTGVASSFRVDADSALACWNPDTAVAGVGTGEARVWYCPYGSTTATCVTDVGASAGSTLDGTGGAAAGQLACVVLGRGKYLLELVTAPAAGKLGVFSVQGGD